MSIASPGEPNSAVTGESRMLSRAFSILRALSCHPEGMSYGELGNATGLPRGTIHRIVAALTLEGAVTKLGGAGAIRLGAGLAQLGAAVQANVRSIARPYLEKLQQCTEETVDLTMLVRGRPVVVEQFVARHGLHVGSFPGFELPIHCSASGLAHLSMLSRHEAEKILPAQLASRIAPAGIDRTRLLNRIFQVGPHGIHRDESAWIDGVCAVAMSLIGPWTESFAIAVTMPAHRYKQKRDEVERALKECVAALTPATHLTAGRFPS
jgi:IclR family transcriptional regulator, acetate operon repressor